MNETDTISVEHPPCLRRRAPARVEITRDGANLPRMTATSIHLRAGHGLKIRVTPQANEAEAPREVRVECSQTFQITSPQTVVNEGQEKSTYLEITSRFRFRLPLPRKAAIHVSTTCADDQPSVTTVWVTVWPSVWTVLQWVFTGFVATLIISKVTEMARGSGFADALYLIVTDGLLLGQAVLIGAACSLLIYAVGWLLVWIGWAPSDSE